MLDGNPNSLHNNNICHQSRRTGMHEYQSPAVAEIYATRRANVIFNQRSTLQNETDSSTPPPPPPSQPGQTVLSGHQQSQNNNNDCNHSDDDNHSDNDNDQRQQPQSQSVISSTITHHRYNKKTRKKLNLNESSSESDGCDITPEGHRVDDDEDAKQSQKPTQSKVMPHCKSMHMKSNEDVVTAGHDEPSIGWTCTCGADNVCPRNKCLMCHKAMDHNCIVQ
eukprot:268070_1